MTLPAETTTQKLIRPVMPELDSLRGIAILVVLFFHGFNIPGATTQLTGAARLFAIVAFGGWTGVYLFFVLSGFLITGILLDSKPKPQYYRRFYIRRALRILPAFYLLLLLLCILPRTGLLEGRRVGWPYIGLSFFYLANVTTLLGVPSQYSALWSLAVEEHFYLVWPTVVRALSRGGAALCALGIVIACPIIRAVTYGLGGNYGAGYTWLVADALAIGALLGVLSRGWLAERRFMRLFSMICLAVAIELFTFGTPFGIWRGSTLFGGVFRRTAVNFLFAGILGISLLLGTSRLKWIVQRPVLQWFGEISYGLYLIHMLAFDFVDHWIVRYDPDLYAHLSSHFGLICMRFLLSMGVATCAAFLSRSYFEEWFLKWKDRLTAPASNLPPHSAQVLVSTEPAKRTA
jgi:peptidoglycan/LPS O-acetylase OafA/YrhL